MGLLGTDWDDPRSMATMQLASGLLGGKNFGQGMSQGLMGYMQAMQQAKQQKAEDEKRALQMEASKLQLEQAKQAAELQRRQQEWRQSLPSPQMQASQAALGGGGGPTLANAAKAPPIDQNAQLLFGAMQQGLIEPAAYLSAIRKDTTPIISKPGDIARDASGRVMWQNPEKEDEFAQRMRAAGVDPASPMGRQTMRDWLKKQTTHPAATQVTYGAPVAAIGDDGQPVYFQPGNKPGAPPQIIPGMRPPKVGDDMHKARMERESTVQTAADSIAVLDKALEHPGRKTATGLSGVVDPRNVIPGTAAKDFRVVADQVKGKAFLQAFESLKGGGQITEVEGTKATNAIARLSTAQSDDEYKVALQELREVVVKGYERASGKAYQPKQPLSSFGGNRPPLDSFGR